MLAAARDTIRLLSWLRSNTPQVSITLVANRVHPGSQPEITIKDFETSVERKIDALVAFDQKLAAQAAKLGKPLAEVGKGSKSIAALIRLAHQLADVDGHEETGASTRGGKGSLLAKLSGITGAVTKKPKDGAAATKNG